MSDVGHTALPALRGSGVHGDHGLTAGCMALQEHDKQRTLKLLMYNTTSTGSYHPNINDSDLSSDYVIEVMVLPAG